MSCCSAIYTVNSNATELAAGSIIPFGAVIRRFGGSLDLTGGSLRLMNSGYYDVDVNVIVDGAATGDITIQLYKDGVAVPGAIATSTVTAAGDTANLNIHAIVRKACKCGDPSDLYLMLVQEATVTNVAVVVKKI